MARKDLSFDEAAAFHGHSCPGLAFGYRVARAALDRLGVERPEDEELVAVVENSSCAVDAVQAVAGCTVGKGNLLLRDYGKQVYTFFKRPSGEGVRIAVSWPGLPESESEQQAWRRYHEGDHSPEVTGAVTAARAKKMGAILEAAADELFTFSAPKEKLPERARVFPTVQCARCGEKMMSPKAVIDGDRVLCIPCAGKV